MKKIIFLFLIFRATFSLEPFLELQGESRLEEFEKNHWYYKAISGVRHGGENYYGEISFIGEEGADPELDLYRGYLEYYIGKSTIYGGRQTITWGHAYLFNLSDVFNEIDIEEPRSEKRGVDSLRARYNITDMSRLEVVGFETDGKKENFAGRYTFLWDDMEVMMNYFNMAEVSPFTQELEKNEHYVLEAKGDMIVGIWGQLSYNRYENDDLSTIVTGLDYNFDIYNKSLYVAAEGIYNEIGSGFYLTYNLQINESFEFYQGYLFAGDGRYINSTVNYIYNDYLNFELAYNFYHKFEGYGYLSSSEKELQDEVVFRAKLYL